MRSIIFIFTGIILIAAGLIVSQSNMNVIINYQHVDSETANNIKHITGLGLGALGALFTLAGLIGFIRNSRQRMRNQHILYHGIETQGTVTFADKNYSILINNTPVYSIVEYTYQDKYGQKHTRRITDINSDIVIRMRIQVGSSIPIKYSAENPAESVIVLSR